MSHCIDVEGDQVYKIGTGFDIEDGVTMVLEDDDEDWWVNGNREPLDVRSLLRAWRRFQSFVSRCSFSNIYLHYMIFFSPSQPYSTWILSLMTK